MTTDTPLDNTTKNPVGRPTKYDPSWMPAKAAELILQGAFEKDVAKALGLGITSYIEYRELYPEFAKAIEQAKKAAIPALIEPALLKAAQGFHYTEKDTFTRDGHSIIHKRFALPNVKAQLAALARYDPEYRQSQQASLSVAIGANLNMRFMGSGDPGPEVIEAGNETVIEGIETPGLKQLPGKIHE